MSILGEGEKVGLDIISIFNLPDEQSQANVENNLNQSDTTPSITLSNNGEWNDVESKEEIINL